MNSTITGNDFGVEKRTSLCVSFFQRFSNIKYIEKVFQCKITYAELNLNYIFRLISFFYIKYFAYFYSNFWFFKYRIDVFPEVFKIIKCKVKLVRLRIYIFSCFNI